MVILAMEDMGRHFSSGVRSATAFGSLAICITSVMMLLLFPATTVHNFGPHFRCPEVYRTAQRHISVTQSDTNCYERIVESAPLPSFLTSIETVGKIVVLSSFELDTELPLSRLLNRMKLKRSGSSSQDPLLQA